MALGAPSVILAATIEHMPERRYQRRAERVLDQRRRNERCDADQPCLFNAEFHAKCKPDKSGGENQDVSEPHRQEKPGHRSIPAAFAQPPHSVSCCHEAEQVSRGRTEQWRKTTDGTCKYRPSERAFGEIGHHGRT